MDGSKADVYPNSGGLISLDLLEPTKSDDAWRAPAMWLARVFGGVGRAVGARPILFALVAAAVCVLSGVLLAVLPKNVQLNFDSGYTTPDAPSIREHNAQVEFFGNLGQPWYMGLFAEPKNGSMTNSGEFHEFQEFYHYVKKNLTVRAEENGKNYTYMSFCEPMCTFNDVLFKTYSMSFFFGLEWPVTSILGYESNIGKYFFERTMKGSSLESSQLQALYFTVFVNSTQMAADMKHFEYLASQAVKRHNEDPTKLTTITQHSALGMEAEIERGLKCVVAHIGVGLAVFALLVLCSLFVSSWVHGASAVRAGLVLVPAVLVPFMALVSAASLHALLGHHFNTIMLFSPLVALGFGVDGIWVIYNQWLSAHSKKIYDKNENQLQEVMAESSPSVLVSALTAVVLLLGTLFPIEEYAQFSVFAGFIVVCSLFYQIFFFTPVLVLCMPVKKHEALNKKRGSKHSSSGKYIRPFSLVLSRSTFAKVVVVGMFISACAIPAALGMHKVRGNLDYRHLQYPDSPASKGVHIMSDIVWPEFLHILFFIEKPPKFDNPFQYTKFMKMLDDIQSINGSMSPRDNMMFVNDFKRFARTKQDADHLDMSKFVGFITDGIYKAWNSGVKYRTFINPETNATEIDVTRMIYMVAFNGTRSLADKADLMIKCREVAAAYQQFDVIPFDTESGMVDVILQAPEVTTILPAAACFFLFFWFLLFAANLTTALIVALSAAATYFCSYGLTALAGLTINPFAVAALLSYGAFSVKAVVHIGYYFQLSSTMKKKDPEQRLMDTLGKGLLPTAQSALCTCALLLPLLAAPIEIFWFIGLLNVTFLCVSLFISVLLVPVILSWLPKGLTGTGCVYTAAY